MITRLNIRIRPHLLAGTLRAASFTDGVTRSGQKPSADARRDIQNLLQMEVKPPSAGLSMKHNLIGLANARELQDGDETLALEALDSVLEVAEVEKDGFLAAKLHSLTMEILFKIKSETSTREAESLFWKLLEQKEKFMTHDEAKNRLVYNDAFCILVNGLSYDSKKRRLTPELENRIEEIIRAMKRLWEDPKVPLKANTPAINTILKIMMKSRNDKEARSTLLSMIHQWKEGDDFLRPNRTSFNTTIFTFALVGKPELAFEIIQYMIHLHQKYPDIPYPDDYAFSSLMYSFANYRQPEAGVKAEKTLEWIMQLHKDGRISLVHMPGSYMMFCVMQAWVMSGSDKAPERVENLLRGCLTAFEEGSRDILPEARLFWAAVSTWSKSKRPQRARKVESIVERMEELYLRHHWDLGQVNEVYKELVRVWLRSDPSRAEAWIQRMKDRGLKIGKLEQKIDALHEIRYRK